MDHFMHNGTAKRYDLLGDQGQSPHDLAQKVLAI
jgi:hypothetical protein